MRACLLIALLLCVPCQSLHAADATSNETVATKIVQDVLQNLRSDGFQVRMQVAVTNADRRIHPPLKVTVIGERKAAQQRLLVRGISPQGIRNLTFAARAKPGLPLLALTSDTHGETDASDPFSYLFDSGITLWDLMTPWWRWPEQQMIGNDDVDGHASVLIRSRIRSSSSSIAEVLSYVDQEEAFSWKTEIFDHNHRLLRTISVKRALRSEAGVLAAKKMVIDLPGKSSSDIQVYSGDEHYHITPETFALIDRYGHP